MVSGQGAARAPMVDDRSVYAHMARGVAWSVTMRWGMRLIGLVSVGILARLLTPQDFGLVTMGAVVIGIIHSFSEFGTQQLLIRTRDTTAAHCNTAWTIKIAQGVFVAAVLVSIAPLAADYFREQRVVPIVLILAGVAILEGFENIGLVLIRKELDFARDFRFNVYKRLLAFMFTIPLAFALRNYWALVAGHVVSSVVAVVLSYRMHPFRPRLSLAYAREYLRFGAAVVPQRIGRAFYQRIDTLVVGRIASTADLGIYNVASQLSSLITNEISAPVGRGLYPNYAQLNRAPALLAEAFQRVLNATSTVIFPVAFGFWVVADDLVPVLLGPKWLDSIILVKWLIFDVVFASFIDMMSSQILFAAGHERRAAVFVWVRLLLMAPVVVAAGMVGGVIGVAMARPLVSICTVPLVALLLAKSIALPVSAQLAAVWRAALATGVMVAMVWVVEPGASTPVLTRLAIDIAVGAATYLSALFVLWWGCGRPPGVERLVIHTVLKRWRRS